MVTHYVFYVFLYGMIQYGTPHGMLERNTVCYVKLHLWYGVGM